MYKHSLHCQKNQLSQPDLPLVRKVLTFLKNSNKHCIIIPMMTISLLDFNSKIDGWMEERQRKEGRKGKEEG